MMGKNKDISFLNAKNQLLLFEVFVLVVSTRAADYLAAFFQFDSFSDTCNKFIANLIVFQGTSEYQQAWILNNSSAFPCLAAP